MKKGWIIGIVAVLILAAVGILSYIVYDHQDLFTGDRVKNPDCYLATFSQMNQTDIHTMTLKNGDVLHVECRITGGKADLSIGTEGEKAIYTGNDLKDGTFDLIIPQDGVYQIRLAAKHAAGSVNITQVQPETAQ